MPRVSAQHEQAVRDRIVRAAIEVFARHGFHRATMQDIVRQSGLSVGAIYTYFKSKSEIILAGCDLITDQELGELRERLASVTDYRERVATALGFFFDQFEEQRSGTGSSVLMTLAWAEVDADPAIREMVRRRRREIVGPTALLLQEGVVRGELPPWLDVESVAHSIAALLDGLTIEAIEEGAAYRRDDAERRALAMLDLLFVARDAAPPVPLVAPPPRPYVSLKSERAS
jgi:AcrR family transcriptional regulator